MADFNNSTNMNLPIPTVGIAGGPTWATLLDSCLTILDGHSHVAGSGVPITPSAMNINIDLSMGGNNLTTARSLRLSANGAALALVTDIGCLYEVGDDLYYNDGAGNQIRMTQAGSIVGSAGSITGLPSGTASAVYSAISSKFVWQSATNTAADMDMGAAIMRNLSPNSTYSLTLQPPSAMGANYALTLPTLPNAQKIMTLDASGIMSAPWVIDNATLEVNSSTVQVKDKGITQVKLQDRTVGTTVGAGGVAISNSCGQGAGSGQSGAYVALTNLSVTITTTGRPVYMFLQPDGRQTSPTVASTSIEFDTSGGQESALGFFRDSTFLGEYQGENGGATTSPPGAFQFLDTPIAGTYTYTVKGRGGTGAPMAANWVKLVAYEL